jgi:pimeloyl-ACP methyl ester carboxylesterase
MGHSYGALCVLEAARLAPNISSLVLYDPPVIGMGPDELQPGVLEEVETLVAKGRREDALARVLGRSSEEIEQLRADLLWGSRVASVHAFPREMRAGAIHYRFNWNGYRDMEQPTLLLAGELSPPRLRASAAGLAAILSHSRLVVLQAQGHGALVTAPQLVAEECIRFLGAQPQTGSGNRP